MSNSNWPRNRLLLALPTRNLKQLMPELEHIPCRREQVLMDADSSLDHVYFPDSGVVSVVAVYADGSVIEMATIGREGCSGMQAFFGAKTSSVRLPGAGHGVGGVQRCTQPQAAAGALAAHDA
jgi:signal-transduction protein with cAMP-binding, CBS, and nucleotidyltransferase domain